MPIGLYALGFFLYRTLVCSLLFMGIGTIGLIFLKQDAN